jgi:hypothetical protein
LRIVIGAPRSNLEAGGACRKRAGYLLITTRNVRHKSKRGQFEIIIEPIIVISQLRMVSL